MKKSIGMVLSAVLITVFFYAPLGLFFATGLNLRSSVFGEVVYWQIIGKTIIYSFISSIFCAIISTPIAISISFNDKRGFNKIQTIALLPLVVNPLTVIFGWILLLRESGPISRLIKGIGGDSILYTPASVITGMVYIGIPTMTFFLINAMRNIDRNIITAAKIIGAGERNTFFRIIFPLTVSSYINGILFVFLSSCGYFIIPSLLGGGQTVFISTIIEQMVNSLLDWNSAAQLSIMFLTVVIVIFFLLKLSTNKMYKEDV